MKRTLEELKDFCKKNNSFPYSRTKNSFERSLYWFSWKNKDNTEIKKLKRKYGKRQRFQLKLEDLFVFCEKNKKFPNQKIIEERPYYYLYLKNKENPIAKRYREQYRKGVVTFEELTLFCTKHNRLPLSKSRNYERRLYLFTLGNKTPEVKELKEIYGRYKMSMKNLVSFCETYNKFPSQYSESKTERGLYWFSKRNSENETIKTLKTKYKNHRLKSK